MQIVIKIWGRIGRAGYMLLLVAALLPAIQCNQSASDEQAKAREILVRNIPAELSWSERMGRSIMRRNPESWMTDFRKTPRWSYSNGLVMTAFMKLWEDTGRQEYYDYAKSYADTMIDADGNIKGYRIDEYNIDHINPGKILFKLYAETDDKRYENTLHTLRRQLEWQPRTTEGGYWHKLRYTWQMWLDGLYMGAPFYAEYAARFGEPASFDDIALQFRLIESHNRDTVSGLLYHGWDESRVQRWSDAQTGRSPHFWGRAMGWYGMALVDVLDHFPQDHVARQELEMYLMRFVEAVTKVQDPETGLWYQILDSPGREGNYLEATASSMFVYTIAKAVNKGLIEERHIETAKKGFDGLTEHLIEVEDSGEVNLLKCCSVAGLGGSPYRDGSFEYYISEEVRSNDPKGTGPFILAVLELQEYDEHVRR